MLVPTNDGTGTVSSKGSFAIAYGTTGGVIAAAERGTFAVIVALRFVSFHLCNPDRVYGSLIVHR
jgi:hypothetical protein